MSYYVHCLLTLTVANAVQCISTVSCITQMYTVKPPCIVNFKVDYQELFSTFVYGLCHYILCYPQLRREFTLRVGNTVQIDFAIIADWATKFEKVLKNQDKNKSVVNLDEVESDGKCNIVCVYTQFIYHLL